jgi:hypothetical protein
VAFILQGDSDRRMTPLNLAKNDVARGANAMKMAATLDNRRLVEEI